MDNASVREPRASRTPIEPTCGEEVLTYGLFVAIGVIPILIAIARGTSFGAQATVGIAMVVAGLAGLGGAWRSQPGDRA